MAIEILPTLEYLERVRQQKLTQEITPKRKTYKKNRNLINSLKTGPCVDCGGKFPAVCMDFDHLGNKRYSIAAMKLYSEKAIMAEVAKCNLVCANCHRIRTESRRRNRKVVWAS